ncbi:MAG TPA: hypothetical protein VKZ81_21585 [Pseudonocardia sp.]|jgi:SAM-dependent methyltransferase|uniref:hypothetical protein n=1 Tax=Pseudonocardia sp. TaxID=60912 RepID=UPI002B4B224A|nr:hypothetical protein [Pseudonocardia sp.]HLU58061.1 hypothetical protein [Pseudonocardia sp.]
MDDPAAAIAEAARVLEPGGILCAAVVHPLNRSAERTEDHFAHHRVAGTVESNGLTMTFAIDRPLSHHTPALERAGFVVEAMREPRPDAAAVLPAPALSARPHAVNGTAANRPHATKAARAR